MPHATPATLAPAPSATHTAPPHTPSRSAGRATRLGACALAAVLGLAAALGPLSSAQAATADKAAPQTAAPRQAATPAQPAPEALMRTLSERIPQLANIDQIQPTAMPGLYEVRVGHDLFYTDARGDYIIQGELIDTRARRNLTEDRINELTAVDFRQLPLKDAIRIVRGKGQRQLAVFEDPNCGYCKRFERDMAEVDNVTVYLFLYPILSRDSVEKSRNIWCAKDRVGAWHDHMLRDKAPAAASCNIDAIERNLAFGRKHKITGTPTLIFANNQRVPGAIPPKMIEDYLQSAHAK